LANEVDNIISGNEMEVDISYGSHLCKYASCLHIRASERLISLEEQNVGAIVNDSIDQGEGCKGHVTLDAPAPVQVIDLVKRIA